MPADVGLVHLDWSRDVAPLAGLDSDPETVGEAATDLLVGQLQANEFGIPKHEKIVAVRGHWVPGISVRRRQLAEAADLVAAKAFYGKTD